MANSNDLGVVRSTLSTLAGRQVEVFYALLVASGKFTFLPELYDIFGRDITIKFLEVFAGCRLSVPTLDKLEKLSRDAAVYVRISQVNERHQASVIHTLADEYGVIEDRIRTIYKDTKELYEDINGITANKKDAPNDSQV